ncbi:MAG TPA: hypothetical protein VFR81_03525 [Longimicrobium sp.]|nr:hypothetical protein [Longimicrobium sp.]
MHALVTRRGASLARLLVLLLAAGGLAACGDEAEVDEVPEVAEVKVDSGPGGVVEVKLEEEYPLGPEDVGKLIYATGTVVGTVVPAGFFLKTEANQVIFVATAQPVNPPLGDAVRVVGPLRASTAAIFEGWKTDALEGEVEAEWQLVTTYFIEAAAVTDV